MIAKINVSTRLAVVVAVMSTEAALLSPQPAAACSRVFVNDNNNLPDLAARFKQWKLF